MHDVTHRMMTLMLQLGVILFAARLGHLAFSRLRLPPVLGELCAGMLVGPYLLGQLPLPGYPGGLFGLAHPGGAQLLSVSPELYGISTLAAVTLLFMVGLETDLKLFLRYSLAGGVTGIGGVVTAFLVGAGLTSLLSPVLLGQSLDVFAPACLMVGVIFTATSVGISSRILAERRKLDTPEGVTILAAAVVDDVLGVVLLAIVLGVAALAPEQGGAFPWEAVSRIAMKTLLVWLMAMTLGLTAAHRIGAGLKWFRHRSVIAALALGLALIVAGLFEAAGLAMIVGAYVTGLSLSRTDLRHVILERLRELDVLLVPVFFAVMGMLVDVRQFASMQMAAFGLLFFVAAMLAKLLGCGLPALLVGFTLRGGARIGAGMVPRGEVTLLMAGAGVAAGLLTPRMLGVLVAMTLLSSLAAPALMLLAFRGRQVGLRKPPPDAQEQQLWFPFPSTAMIDVLTAKLVAVFEAEGFYVHQLNREAGLFQLRQDRVVIGFRKTDSGIVFDCLPRDIPFVRTAMVEVVAELEQTIKELRKPLNLQAFQSGAGAGVAGAQQATPAQVALRDALRPSLLCPRLEADTREGVIGELLDRICAAGYVQDRSLVLQSILSREESLSTGLENGIAIPHARTDAVKRLVCAIGLKPEGVDFSASDAFPARIIVLMLAPKRAGVPYLKFISMISQVLNDQGRASLLACDTAEDMYAVLTGMPRRTGSLLNAFLHRGPARGGDPLDDLRPEWVVLDLNASTRESAIEALLDQCSRNGVVKSVAPVRAAVLEREQIMSTAVGHGVALPHARTDQVSRLVCSIGVLREGVDFGAPDGERVRIVVLTLIPPGETLAYPRLIAGLTRALNAEGRQALLAAGSPEQVLSALRGVDGK